MSCASASHVSVPVRACRCVPHALQNACSGADEAAAASAVSCAPSLLARPAAAWCVHVRVCGAYTQCNQQTAVPCNPLHPQDMRMAVRDAGHVHGCTERTVTHVVVHGFWCARVLLHASVSRCRASEQNLSYPHSIARATCHQHSLSNPYSQQWHVHPAELEQPIFAAMARAPLQSLSNPHSQI